MIKKLLFICILVGGGWYFQNNYLSNSNVSDEVAKKLLSSIVEIRADQFEVLVKSGMRNQRPTLLYIYESNCLMCKWHFKDINAFARQYTRKQLNVILLSLDSEPIELAKFLYNNRPNVRPLILAPGEREKIFSQLRRMGSDYDGTVPHIGVINKAGTIEDVQTGWDPTKKINGNILRALDAKQ